MLGEIRLGQVRLGLSKHLSQLTANRHNTTKDTMVVGADPVEDSIEG